MRDAPECMYSRMFFCRLNKAWKDSDECFTTTLLAGRRQDVAGYGGCEQPLPHGRRYPGTWPQLPQPLPPPLRPSRQAPRAARGCGKEGSK